MVKTYSKKSSGAKQITPHFKIREFACNDGSDRILVDVDGVKKLEYIRIWASDSVRVTSGYRTPEYNRKIGGASASYHTKGQAFDIVVSGKTTAQVARFAQLIGFGGIEVNQDTNYTHVDTRTKKYYWIHRGGRDIAQSTFGGACPYTLPSATLKRGSTGTGVRWLQFHLSVWGFSVTADGSFGANTEKAVKDFQKRLGLTADGIVGAKTKNALRGIS